MIREMGRPKTVTLDLPQRMTARRLKSGKVLFYYQSGRNKIPLGADIAHARMEWARLENATDASGKGFKDAADRYEKEEIPKKAPKTQREQKRSLMLLIEAFGGLPIDMIRPLHVRQYLDQRAAKVSANREVALLSTIYNWARERGLTDQANPCAGVKKHPEKARRRYVTDEEFQQTYDRAPRELRDAMDLALLTGQRPSDTLKMTRQDVRDGHLWVTQGKTGAKLGIKIEGELEAVLKRIQGAGTIASMYLVHDDAGQRLSIWQLEERFKKARTGDWQFRDLRAKTATDSPTLKDAQQLLGHSNEQTTAAVYRRMRGDRVAPLKRQN